MSPNGSENLLRRSVVVLGLLCALTSGIGLLERGVSAWRAAHIAPGTAMTSGGEQDSVFAVWRVVHGQAVYVDPTQTPYAAAYFNWLFYASYAQPAKVGGDVQGDAAIAKTGRLITAAGALAGFLLLFWLLWRVGKGAPAFAAGVASFVFLGPLVGWWAHTVRPDVWAFTFETAGLTVLLAGLRKRPVAATLVAALLFYAAWAFKQTYIGALGSAILFLIIRKQWRLAALLAVSSLVLVAATFASLGPAYREGVLHGGSVGTFQLGVGWMNLVDMFKKTLPIWLLAVPAVLRRREEVDTPGSASDLRLLGCIGVVVTLPLSFLGSCKVGASSNYYLSLQLMLALLSLDAWIGNRMKLLAPTALAIGTMLQLLVVTGRLGVIDMLPQAREHAAIWSVWKKEAEPRFSDATAFNQPWLNPGSPPFVLAFNYGLYRSTGREFVGGGIGGLIAAGYFQSLLLPATTKDTYDGAPLLHYTRGETVEGNLAVFRLAKAP